MFLLADKNRWLARLPLALLCLLTSARLSAAPAFEPLECREPAASAGARCGIVYVPENHAKPRGRKIPLNVIVLPATGTPLDPRRAQYDLEGGPGFAVTNFVAFYAGEGANYRADRDIVLADLRGTGGSNPLRCAGVEELESRDPWAPLYPPDLVAECAAQLSVANDPAQYSTAAAARDIDLVRRALGYKQLDLNAVSYGTTLALRYLTDFPRAVHAAALMGTVPADRTPPRWHAQSAEAALLRLAADCAADRACREEVGDLQAALKSAVAQLPRDRPGVGDVFMEKLRTKLYSVASTRALPAQLQAAAHGDFDAFLKPGEGGFADGLYLSITCAESLARMDLPAAVAAADDTGFGAYRLERQRDACARWPKAPVDAHLFDVPPSTVPALFIAGDRDPVSPADWAAQTAKRFSDHKLVRVDAGAHVFDGLTDLDTCLDTRIIEFFATADAAGLDTSCFARMQPPPFAP
ncbi:MAG TPA: alpha/beta fold hydrolase [Steroidobacteraceae bacterium]|nr:alpha/beta fold hydrolase [Steroidobacteraceae bacterium]